jgi:predicted SprT family Zn-dependent metalloprotease
MAMNMDELNAIDLNELYDELNAQHWGGRLRKVRVVWVYGDWNGAGELNGSRIRLNYSQAWLHGWAWLRGVLLHEMCHVAIPTRRRNGKRVMHGLEFKRECRRVGTQGGTVFYASRL